MVTGQRPRASEFPEPERCARHAELSGEGSLRQPPIESATANVLTKRLGLVRITPWNRGLSARTQPEAGKRQRNGAGADFNCGIRRSYRRPKRGRWLPAAGAPKTRRPGQRKLE